VFSTLSSYLILYRDYQFEAIEPVRSEVVAKAGFVSNAFWIDAKMSGYDLADSKIDNLLHDRASFHSEKTNQRVATNRSIDFVADNLQMSG
jgi:hypothetical protein